MSNSNKTSERVVDISNLTKTYGEFKAVDDLTMHVNRGGILGFIGPNGAGKTTTIKVLVGLAKPTSGSASIGGADCVKDVAQLRRLVGYMPDVFGAYDNMRVREYLDFFGAAFKVPRKIRAKRIDECMELTGASYMRDLFVESLSHGMKQRVAIARTLLHDPEVLILDEPANGLDPNARIEMRQILLRLAEMGKTLIVTSHILPELSRICDVVAIITRGKLRGFGTLDQIMRQITQRRVMELQLVSSDAVARAAEVLKTGLESDAEVNPAPTEAMVRFTTQFDDTKLSRLLAAIIKLDIEVAQFREVPMDLEDAFLSVTKNDRVNSGARTEETANS